MHACSFQALPQAAGTAVTVQSRYQTYQKVDPGVQTMKTVPRGAGGGAVRACGERKHSNWFDIK